MGDAPTVAIVDTVRPLIVILQSRSKFAEALEISVDLLVMWKRIEVVRRLRTA